MSTGQRAYGEERGRGASTVVDAIRRHVILNDGVVVVDLPRVVAALEDGARIAEACPLRDRLSERTEMARRMAEHRTVFTGM